MAPSRCALDREENGRGASREGTGEGVDGASVKILRKWWTIEKRIGMTCGPY
jgi:hypothetical protein